MSVAIPPPPLRDRLKFKFIISVLSTNHEPCVFENRERKGGGGALKMSYDLGATAAIVEVKWHIVTNPWE